MSLDELHRQHVCNAYCRRDEHCDTFYVSTDNIMAITRGLQDRLGIGVIDVQPAAEAMPLDDDDAVILFGDDGPQIGSDVPMLVWWTEPTSAVQP